MSVGAARVIVAVLTDAATGAPMPFECCVCWVTWAVWTPASAGLESPAGAFRTPIVKSMRQNDSGGVGCSVTCAPGEPLTVKRTAPVTGSLTAMSNERPAHLEPARPAPVADSAKTPGSRARRRAQAREQLLA